MTAEQKATAALVAAAKEAWSRKMFESKERDAEQFHRTIMGAKRLAAAAKARTAEVSEAVQRAMSAAEPLSTCPRAILMFARSAATQDEIRESPWRRVGGGATLRNIFRDLQL